MGRLRAGWGGAGKRLVKRRQNDTLDQTDPLAVGDITSLRIDPAMTASLLSEFWL
jgi:hypothetical protein